METPPEQQQQQQQQVSLGSKEHTNIIKGKRTKRVRPQSPIPFSITANSSTAEGDGEREDFYNGDDVVNNNNNNNNTSPTTSYVTGLIQESSMIDEEHDMANCLILLAQGQSRELSSPKNTTTEEDGGMNYTKYSSRKFMEAASLDSGRAGYYVYECKTCNRTFPSFQALGGHRASHKKPKALPIAQDRKQPFFDDEEFQFKTNNNHKSISLQFNKGNVNNNNKSKVHECSICGSEFTSGQALGGHMRRHRAPVGTSSANTTLSLTPMSLVHEDHARKRRNVLSLDLDLNLPAPEDDQRESKFAFGNKQQQQQQQHQQQQQQQQQQSLVFSAPALVDCHY
ncbi:uncharacterized protein [Cicer arietinum]|uniref:Zinc finger protein ZAT5 n=1 Tax=Cicer arietinum TaxID=3827 RepID=A0A1S3E4S6_CICAR|nr:zinc finger protein ZAT5 [Cicer arietinum]